MQEQYIHYVYVTTNLVNGKQYIGDHTIKSKEKYYLGSGKIFLNAIKKYGEHVFFKEILEWFSSRQEASFSQEKYINYFNTLIPDGYNISPKGGIGVQGCHSKETCAKIGESLKGEKNPNFKKVFSAETRKKMGKGRKGKITWMKGKHHTEETRKKQRESAKNRPQISEETSKKLSILHKGQIPWNKDLKMPVEFGKKISETHIKNQNNKGDKNGMYKKSNYMLWVEKYGEDVAQQKLKERSEKASKSLKGKKHKKIKQNLN